MAHRPMAAWTAYGDSYFRDTTMVAASYDGPSDWIYAVADLHPARDTASVATVLDSFNPHVGTDLTRARLRR